MRALGPGEIRTAMDPCSPVSVPVVDPLCLGLLGLGTGALRSTSRSPGGPPGAFALERAPRPGSQPVPRRLAARSPLA
jgi:hypothetical protein